MSIEAKRGIHFIPGSARTIDILPNTQKKQFFVANFFLQIFSNFRFNDSWLEFCMKVMAMDMNINIFLKINFNFYLYCLEKSKQKYYFACGTKKGQK